MSLRRTAGLNTIDILNPGDAVDLGILHPIEVSFIWIYAAMLHSIAAAPGVAAIRLRSDVHGVFDNEISRLADLLGATAEKGADSGAKSLRGHIMTLLGTHLLRCYPAVSSETELVRKDDVETIAAFIEANLGERLSVADVGRRFGFKEADLNTGSWDFACSDQIDIARSHANLTLGSFERHSGAPTVERDEKLSEHRPELHILDRTSIALGRIGREEPSV